MNDSRKRNILKINCYRTLLRI